MKTSILLILSLTVLSATSAFAQYSPPVTSPDYKVSPGTMGPNAFAPWMWRVTDAHVYSDGVVVDVSYRYIKDRFSSFTHTGVARVEIPFSALSSLEITYLYEKWKLSNEGLAQFDPRTASGANVGDVIARFKTRLVGEKPGKWWPTVSVSVSVKTASGGFEDRRFTDSTGYAFDFLVAKDILMSNPTWLRKIRIIGEAGFMAWDDGVHSQNDAYRYGLAAQFVFNRGWMFTTGFHGYTGWRKNFDRPQTLYFEAQKQLGKRVRLFTSADYGLRDVSPYTYSVGIRVTMNWKPAKKNKPIVAY